MRQQASPLSLQADFPCAKKLLKIPKISNCKGNKKKTNSPLSSLVGEALRSGFLSTQDWVLEVKQVPDFVLATQFQPANTSVSSSPWTRRV